MTFESKVNLSYHNIPVIDQRKSDRERTLSNSGPRETLMSTRVSSTLEPCPLMGTGSGPLSWSRLTFWDIETRSV